MSLKPPGYIQAPLRKKTIILHDDTDGYYVHDGCDATEALIAFYNYCGGGRIEKAIFEKMAACLSVEELVSVMKNCMDYVTIYGVYANCEEFYTDDHE